MIYVTLLEETIYIFKYLLKEMIEATEGAETIDQVQDLRKEMIEATEGAETIDQVQDLRKSLLVKRVLIRKINLKTNITL
jgi:hypothetical protein